MELSSVLDPLLLDGDCSGFCSADGFSDEELVPEEHKRVAGTDKPNLGGWNGEGARINLRVAGTLENKLMMNKCFGIQCALCFLHFHDHEPAPSRFCSSLFRGKS